MIQVISYSDKDYRYNSDSRIELNSFKSARSLDEYEINVIDLNFPQIWEYHGSNNISIDAMNDFVSLEGMINRAEIGKTLILLPQNATYKCDFYNKQFRETVELKDMLTELACPLLAMLFQPFEYIRLEYERTRTEVAGKLFDAAFFFPYDEGILKSKGSKKTTAINFDNVFLSTLFIDSAENLFAVLEALSLVNKQPEIPKWLDDTMMFDDAVQHASIAEFVRIIDEMKQKIRESESVIVNNRHLKSALIASGEQLVQVVFEILEELFGCDLSDFVDDKKEDFLFEYDDVVYIGEIKGVNHNVKSENVSQLDVHYQGYIEEHPEDKKKVKALLIMNSQKNKPLSGREPVKDTQIKLAERNGSLIIDTFQLLKLLEKYREGFITRDEINNTLSKQTGLFVL